MGNLNNRFANYIEKVRYLEEQNKILELKIKQASKRQSEIEKNEQKGDEIQSYRINIDDITMIKVRLQVERDNLKGDAVELTRKLEDENALRNDLDDELQRLRKDVDDATMVRVDLERKIETLREELEYNRKVHSEEIEDLKEQIASQGINVEVDGITPDMNEILRDIRQEYETIAIKNRDEERFMIYYFLYNMKCELSVVFAEVILCQAQLIQNFINIQLSSDLCLAQLIQSEAQLC